MTILAPCDANEMRNLIPTTLKWPHPVYIRLSRGDEPLITKKNRSAKEKNFKFYQGVSLFKPNLKELKQGLKIDLDQGNLQQIEN